MSLSSKKETLKKLLTELQDRSFAKPTLALLDEPRIDEDTVDKLTNVILKAIKATKAKLTSKNAKLDEVEQQINSLISSDK